MYWWRCNAEVACSSAIIIWVCAVEHKVDVIGCLIEVRSLLRYDMSIPPHRPDLSMGWLVSKSSEERCQVSVAASQVREEEEMRGKMEWLWQVSWWLWEREAVGIKAQAVILLCSLQRDNLLKWGMDLKSKWVDLKPLGHYPPCCSVCDCIHPHGDWQPLSLSNNGSVIFPRHWKTPLSTGWRTSCYMWGQKCGA